MAVNKKKLAHYAAENNDLDMIKLLVEFNVDIESGDKNGMTPLFYAIEQKDTVLARYLISLGANIHHIDFQQRSLVYWASSWGELDSLKLLLGMGWDSNIKSNLGRTALSKAWWNGFTEVVRLLLQTNRISVNESDSSGRTSLHNAVWGSHGGRLGEKVGFSDGDSPECAQLLLEYGADPNYRDNAGNSPFSIAWSTYGINWIRLLLAYGANINLMNNSEKTPFLNACDRGYYEVWKILYEYDELNPYVKSRRGYSCLELVIGSGKDKFIKWIISEKLNNIEYPGLKFSEHNLEVLLHHAANSSNNTKASVKEFLNYMYTYELDFILKCFLDCFNRALLRNSNQTIQAFQEFYEENKLDQECQLSEVILEASSHTSPEIFNWVLERYEQEVPVIWLFSLIISRNYILLESLLLRFSKDLKFWDIDLESVEIHASFTKIIDNDLLSNYRVFKKISHPIFSNPKEWNLIR